MKELDLHIRQAESRDWDALWLLLSERGSDSEVSARARFTQMLHQKEHCLQVAVLGDTLVGYTWAQDYGPHLRNSKRTARLHDLFVAASHRRQGVGTLLLGAVRDWAQKEGVTWLQWQASRAAIPFYEQLGFKGDPCPDPEHPFFEIEFTQQSAEP